MNMTTFKNTVRRSFSSFTNCKWNNAVMFKNNVPKQLEI